MRVERPQERSQISLWPLTRKTLTNKSTFTKCYPRYSQTAAEEQHGDCANEMSSESALSNLTVFSFQSTEIITLQQANHTLKLGETNFTSKHQIHSKKT